MSSNSPQLLSAFEDKEAIQVQTQKLFQQILKDMLQSRLSVNQPQDQSSNTEHNNLSGLEQKLKLAQLHKRRLFQQNKAKYEQMMLNMIRSKFIVMENELKELREYKVQHESQDIRYSNQTIKSIKQLMEQESNKQQVLVQIAKILDFNQDVLTEFEEWKQEAAEHRKIFTKYTTIMTQYYPFAMENIIKFIGQVDQQFEFNLKDQINKFKDLEVRAQKNDKLKQFESILLDKSKTNAQKINCLYNSHYLSCEPDSINKDIFHLMSIQRSAEIGNVYTQLLNQKQEQLRQQHQLQLNRVKSEMESIMKLGIQKFKDLQRIYAGLLKMEVKADNKDEEIIALEDLSKYYEGEITRTEKIINFGKSKYNARKSYFRLIETEVK